MDATKRTARRAGQLYSLFGLFGPFVLPSVPRKLFVIGGAATAEHLYSSENLLRMATAAEVRDGIQ